MRIGVHIASQQKGFLISVAKRLSRCHEVIVLARDKNVAAIVRREAPELVQNMLVLDAIDISVSPEEVLERARAIEARYNLRISFFLSRDRGLGKGYIFNADRHPDVGASWWSHERKLLAAVKRFALAESVLIDHGLDVLLCLRRKAEFSAVAEAIGIDYYSIATVKLGSRVLISDDEYMTSGRYLDRLRSLLNDQQNMSDVADPYEQERGSQVAHASLSYTWSRVVKDVGLELFGGVKRVIRQTGTPDGYRLLGWLPYLVRRKLAYDYFIRHGQTPKQLSGYRLIYFPLHLEPEIALLDLSPEFNNSAEIIAWVSKSLPVDALLVVKEQPFAFGMRSKTYYDMLRRIGNVVFACPKIKSWDWIEASALVVGITGTSAIEAVAMGRPVLSFGAHQIVNLLPSVRFADSFSSTQAAVEELLGMRSEDARLRLAASCLRRAQVECSFDLPGFERTYGSSSQQPELASRFVAGLEDFDPRIRCEA